MDIDEFGLLVRPAVEIHKEECQTSTLEEDRKQLLSVQERDHQEEDNKEHQEEQKQQGSNVIISVPPPLKNLKLEIPSYEDAVRMRSVNDESNEGFKTPTSSDQKIPVVLPGAPRKKKSRPAKKRKTACCQRIVLDMSKELESLFPMPFVVDLCAGRKNKKVKQCSRNQKT